MRRSVYLLLIVIVLMLGCTNPNNSGISTPVPQPEPTKAATPKPTYRATATPSRATATPRQACPTNAERSYLLAVGLYLDSTIEKLPTVVAALAQLAINPLHAFGTQELAYIMSDLADLTIAAQDVRSVMAPASANRVQQVTNRSAQKLEQLSELTMRTISSRTEDTLFEAIEVLEARARDIEELADLLEGFCK